MIPQQYSPLQVKTTFNKRQTLYYSGGHQLEEPNMVADVPQEWEDGFNGSPQSDPGTFGTKSFIPRKTKLPMWVEHDRKVLRFYGYFKESVVESRVENQRSRKIVLYYYLEDDTMHIGEPRQDNSGLPQGMFLKRHRAIKQDGSQFNPSDFMIGQPTEIYSRTIILLDCDKFTREFFKRELGIEQPEAQAYPVDPIDIHYEQLKRKTKSLGPPNPRSDDLTRFVEAKLGKASHVLNEDQLEQYLKNSRKVLRFWAFWDDRTKLYGDRRPYVIHYYLEDDSIEILEVFERNSGRDPFPVFLKRGPLPKESVFDQMAVTKKIRKEQCYRPEDLQIGQYICVYNRQFGIFDCDDFTRRWYKDNFGYDDKILAPIAINEQVPAKAKAALAPYNGYGTIEDSEQNCVSLMPKPPKKDLRKLINKDRMVLRFECQFKDDNRNKVSEADKSRKFILSYFMADDTISLFEPPIRNSGFIGGKYLERSRIYKHDSQDTFTFKDLFVGATMFVNGRTFELLEADEYTYTYMENNQHLFVMADAEAIIKLLKPQMQNRENDIRTVFIEIDTDGSGNLSWQELGQALERSSLKVTKHQIIALCRYLDKDESGEVSIEEFLTAVGMKDKE